MSTCFFLFILHTVYSIQIKTMAKARFDLQCSSSLNVVNTTKEECICTMLSSTNIIAFNYFSYGACQFFSNQSIMNTNFSYSIDFNSSFYFLEFPTQFQSQDCRSCKYIMSLQSLKTIN